MSTNRLILVAIAIVSIAIAFQYLPGKPSSQGHIAYGV